MSPGKEAYRRWIRPSHHPPRRPTTVLASPVHPTLEPGSRWMIRPACVFVSIRSPSCPPVLGREGCEERTGRRPSRRFQCVRRIGQHHRHHRYPFAARLGVLAFFACVFVFRFSPRGRSSVPASWSIKRIKGRILGGSSPLGMQIRFYVCLCAHACDLVGGGVPSSPSRG